MRRYGRTGALRTVLMFAICLVVAAGLDTSYALCFGYSTLSGCASRIALVLSVFDLPAKGLSTRLTYRVHPRRATSKQTALSADLLASVHRPCGFWSQRRWLPRFQTLCLSSRSVFVVCITELNHSLI